MNTEKILYTDGREVTVTDSTFQVKKTSYQLEGIIKHAFLIIRPSKIPFFAMLLIGTALITLGAMHAISAATIPDLEIGSLSISANAIALSVGIVFLLIGIVMMAVVKDHYAVRISTAEGEKNVIESPSKEYIAQIVDALNKAYMSLVSSQGKGKKWAFKH